MGFKGLGFRYIGLKGLGFRGYGVQWCRVSGLVGPVCKAFKD